MPLRETPPSTDGRPGPGPADRPGAATAPAPATEAAGGALVPVGDARWHHGGDLAARAMRLVDDGTVERVGAPGLARVLGYSPRQVQRVLIAETGEAPLGAARARRADTAKLLLETTTLGYDEVAHAAGCTSVRSLHTRMREVFDRTPGELRAAAGLVAPAVEPTGHTPTCRAVSGPLTVHLRLAARAPFDASTLFAHLVVTGVPGAEEWRDGAWRVALRLPHGTGVAALSPRGDHVAATVHLADSRDFAAAVARCRRALDLDADAPAVHEALMADEVLAPLVAAAPGLRVPHVVDPAEFALRAVLGQQVSTLAARTHTGRLTAALGDPVHDPDGGLTKLFPRPEVVAALDPDDYDPSVLAVPRARRRTLVLLARALAEGLDLGPGCDRAEALAALAAVPGVGPLTRDTIALRALADPDAFVAGDLGVRTSAARLHLPHTPPGLVQRAERWRPWRAYAVQYLWAAGPHEVTTFVRRHLAHGPGHALDAPGARADDGRTGPPPGAGPT